MSDFPIKTFLAGVDFSIDTVMEEMKPEVAEKYVFEQLDKTLEKSFFWILDSSVRQDFDAIFPIKDF